MRRMLDVDIPVKGSRGRPNLRGKDLCKGDIESLGLMEAKVEERYSNPFRRPQMMGQARDEEEERQRND